MNFPRQSRRIASTPSRSLSLFAPRSLLFLPLYVSFCVLLHLSPSVGRRKSSASLTPLLQLLPTLTNQNYEKFNRLPGDVLLLSRTKIPAIGSFGHTSGNTCHLFPLEQSEAGCPTPRVNWSRRGRREFCDPPPLLTEVITMGVVTRPT